MQVKEFKAQKSNNCFVCGEEIPIGQTVRGFRLPGSFWVITHPQCFSLRSVLLKLAARLTINVVRINELIESNPSHYLAFTIRQNHGERMENWLNWCEQVASLQTEPDEEQFERAFRRLESAISGSEELLEIAQKIGGEQ